MYTETSKYSESSLQIPNDCSKNIHYIFIIFGSWSSVKGQWFKVGLSNSKKNCVICFIEGPVTMMKNAFYFILKALFVLKVFKFSSWLFGHVEEKAWLKIQGCFKSHDVTTWLTNNYNTHIAQYRRK